MVPFLLLTSAAPPPKPTIDKNKPTRLDRLFVGCEGNSEQAKILASTLVILDMQARARAPLDFHRHLVRFADGTWAAIDSTGDYSREDVYLIRSWVVDVEEGEWVLLTPKGKTPRGTKGYGAAKVATKDEDQQALVGFLKNPGVCASPPKYEQGLDKGNTGEVFRPPSPNWRTSSRGSGSPFRSGATPASPAPFPKCSPTTSNNCRRWRAAPRVPLNRGGTASPTTSPNGPNPSTPTS